MSEHDRTYRVAVIAACPFPCPRGTPIRILRLSEALQRRGHEVEVITYHLSDGTEPPLPVHRTARWPFYRKIAAGPSYQKLLVMDPLLLMRTISVLRKQSFDLIHAHHAEGLLVGLIAGKLLGIPVVFDAHTSLNSELPDYGLGLASSLKRKMGRLFDRLISPRAQQIIVVTPSLRKEMLAVSGITEDRITVASNGVERECFVDASPVVPPHDEGPPRLIYTGSLGPYQRIDLMLDSFTLLLEKRPEARLQIVTEVPDESLGHDIMARGLGKNVEVIYAAFLDLPAYLAAADVAINPRTVCAGIPQKLLNYMAAGVPIVSFAGSAKTLEHEETGLIVPDDDVAAMADACLRLIDDPALAQRLGEAAHDYAKENFDWDHAAQKVEDVYHRLFDGSPSEVRNAKQESANGLMHPVAASQHAE